MGGWWVPIPEECDPNMATLTPDSFIMRTGHLESVLVETGL